MNAKFQIPPLRKRMFVSKPRKSCAEVGDFIVNVIFFGAEPNIPLNRVTFGGKSGVLLKTPLFSKHRCLSVEFGLNYEILALIWAESGVIITNYPCRIECMGPEDLSNQEKKTFAFAKRLGDGR